MIGKNKQSPSWSKAAHASPRSQSPSALRLCRSEWTKLKGSIELYKVRREQARDELTKAFALEGLFAAIVLNTATAFTSMYATRMGASATQIGLLASLPQFLAMLILIPASLLAGRFREQRRPVEIFALLSGVFYGLGCLAPLAQTWSVAVLTLCIALGNAAINIYNSSWQSYFSTVVPFSKRNHVYSARTSRTFITGTMVVLLSGIVLSAAKTDQMRIILYQLCYFLSFIFALWQRHSIRRLPSAISSANSAKLRDLLGAGKLLFKQRAFLPFAGIAILFHAGWYMAWPLFFLNQVRYCGANEAWISYITVSGTLLQAALVGFWGRYIERKGKLPALFFGMAGLATNPFFSALSGYLPAALKLPSLLLFNLLGCAAFTAFQLAFLQQLLLVIPSEQRHLNLALFNTCLLAVNSLMQMLGVSIYNSLGATQAAMGVSMSLAGSLRLLATILIFWQWKKQPSYEQLP